MPTGEGLNSETKAKRGTAALQILWLPAIALVAAILAAWLLKPVVEHILASPAVHDCDTQLLAWFRAQATPALDRVFQGITLLGSPFAMVMYAFVGLSVLVNRREWLLLFTWDVMFLGLLALTQTLKPMYHRARPTDAAQFLHGISYGFPSSHALGAIAAFGMIAFALAEATGMERESRAVLWIFTTILIITISVSRLYLGVHFLSDVLAGLLVGGVWLAVCLFALRRAKSNIRFVIKLSSTHS